VCELGLVDGGQVVNMYMVMDIFRYTPFYGSIKNAKKRKRQEDAQKDEMKALAETGHVESDIKKRNHEKQEA